MVCLVNLVLFRNPAVRAIESHRYFGFQIALPLFMPSRSHHHNAFSVPKRMGYNKCWDIVFDTTYGTLPYAVSRVWRGMNVSCARNERFWEWCFS
jgi:hypothetical protein